MANGEDIYAEMLGQIKRAFEFRGDCTEEGLAFNLAKLCTEQIAIEREEAYEEGYTAGYETGYDRGVDYGEDIGRAAGYEDGLIDGAGIDG